MALQDPFTCTHKWSYVSYLGKYICESCFLTKWGGEEDEEVTKKMYVNGLNCMKCNEHYPWAESNQPDGRLLCYSCRGGRKIKKGP